MPEGLLFIDIIAAIALGFGLIKGWSNGFIKEIAGLIGVILGIWAGFRLSFLFAEWYAENTELPGNMIPFIAFATAFAAAMAGVLLLGRMLRYILEKAEMKFIDRAAGSAFGLLKWAFIAGTLISLGGKAHLIPESTKESSFSYGILTTYCEGVTEYSIGLIPTVKNVFTELDGYFDQIEDKRQEEVPSDELEDPGS